MDQVSWTRMDHGSKEDYEYLDSKFTAHASEALVDNIVALLQRMKGPKLGYQIDRYDHSLQTASRALRADERLDLVLGALLHDIGDTIAPENHSAIGADILEPYIDDEATWVIRHHGVFQGYYYFHHLGGDRNARDIYRDHPYYDACVHFCAEYDQTSFDPDYPNVAIEDFIPMMEELFARRSKSCEQTPLPS